MKGEEEGKKKKENKRKEEKENKSRSPFLELLGKVTAQPNVCARRTAASHPLCDSPASSLSCCFM